MVDNFKHIKPLLNFSDEDKFYYIQIIRRKKENSDAKSSKVIDNIYVSNEEYFNRKELYIKEACDFFNARAYIRLNKRSYRQVALEMLSYTANLIQDRNYKAVSSAFSKACGRTNAEENKIWVIDMDYEDYGLGKDDPDDEDFENHFTRQINNVKTMINDLHSEINNREYKIITELPTKNGIHILSNPFNSKKFSDEFPEISIHKDNPTILYQP